MSFMKIREGGEFFLTQSVQELFGGFRSCQDIALYRQTEFKTICFLAIVLLL